MAANPNPEIAHVAYTVTVWNLGGKYLGYQGKISAFSSEAEAMAFATQTYKGPPHVTGVEVWEGEGKCKILLAEFGHIPW
jgi:hypothetical protein